MIPHTGARRKRHRGVLKIEALLTLVMLVAAMNFASTMVHRINRLWSDSQRHQFAINELSNQLNQFVLLSKEEATIALESISVSSACKQTLQDASITGQILDEELGVRITLELTWIDKKNANPIHLSGWLHEPSKEEQPE